MTNEGPRLTVAAVASRLGVAPATLRTWDRRYGLGPSEHSAGSHRRYSPADVGRLATMRRLLLEGVAPAEAAAAALQEDGTSAGAAPEQFPDRLGRLPAPVDVPVEGVPDAEDVVRGLDRAARALDGDAVVATVSEQLRRHGVLAAWESVLVPVLVAVGQRWAQTGDGVEVEHLVSDCVTTALRQHAGTVKVTGRPVLLACAPDDLHVLPLHALAAALGERGHGCRVLGASVPAPALQAAVRRTSPSALFVWSQTRATGDVALLEAVPVTRPATAVVVGGPGWPEELPDRVTRADGLGAALDLVGRATTGEALASSG